MSTTTITPSRSVWLGLVQRIGSTLLIGALLAAGFFGGHLFAPTEDPGGDTAAEADFGAAKLVELGLEKVAKAGVTAAPASITQIQPTRIVAAKLTYDDSRRLAVRAPVDCVVEQWLVSPGAEVAKGQPVVRLSGAEVALARSEIKRNEAEVAVAQIAQDWAHETRENLKELLAALRQRPAHEEVQERFHNKRLGDHRDMLVKKYAQLLLAESVADRTSILGRDGVIAGRTAEANASARDIAATEFKTACEQSEHDSAHELAEANAALNLAEQKLLVAKQRLSLLLGPNADLTTDKDSADFVVVAPFAGRVNASLHSPTARVAQGDLIVEIADGSQLWLSALLHQHDLTAVQVEAGDAIKFEAPGFPEDSFPATVRFVGATVESDTRAVSLVAEVDNAKGRLRPGMFCWAALPTGPPRRAITAPPAAIQRHESKPFVFLELEPGRYERVDVEVGLETAEYVEIKQGVNPGQRVIEKGSFFLKSELLLEQEEE